MARRLEQRFAVLPIRFTASEIKLIREAADGRRTADYIAAAAVEAAAAGRRLKRTDV